MGALRTAGWWVAAAAVLASPHVGPAAASPPPPLSVTGEASGLQPGVEGELWLTVHNPGTASAVVHAVRAWVSGGDCDPATLGLEDWSGRLDLPAGGAADVVLPIWVETPCPEGSWALAYRAETS